MRNDRNVGTNFFFSEEVRRSFLHASGSHETCEFPVTRSRKALVIRHCCRKRNEVRRTYGSVGVDPWISPGAADIFIGVSNSGKPTDFALIPQRP